MTKRTKVQSKFMQLFYFIQMIAMFFAVYHKIFTGRDPEPLLWLVAIAAFIQTMLRIAVTKKLIDNFLSDLGKAIDEL